MQIVVVTAFLLTADQVANAGGVEALIVDTGGCPGGEEGRLKGWPGGKIIIQRAGDMHGRLQPASSRAAGATACNDMPVGWAALLTFCQPAL